MLRLVRGAYPDLRHIFADGGYAGPKLRGAFEGAGNWTIQIVKRSDKAEGFEDILIAVVDGQKGFPDAINAAFPETTVQTCIVHLVRHSLNFCGWKDRKNVAKDLKRIYSTA